MKKRIIYLLIFLAIVVVGCNRKVEQKIHGEKVREYANELYDRYLFEQAIEQYEFYLNNYQLEEKEQANVVYRIGNIYFERLHDYQNAMAAYLKIKVLYPQSEVITEVNKKLIACLERLQRPEDASQALHESTSIEPSKREQRPGSVIAKIGDKDISQGDLDFEISQLSPEIRAQFQDKQRKLEFLRSYVATELMYDSAKRAGYENDKSVMENLFQAKKSFMVQKLLQERLKDKVKLQAQDVELYYQAHKDRYTEKDKDGKLVREIPLSEAQNQVAQDLFQERYQKAYQELMMSLLSAENVKIYDDLVK
ncbi:MAG: hypothetical protein A2Y62_00490 [Candidatus Fischerbacteria bacterium RBG_13_37_8]|uniref:PpiC domain-containing protein n=1 Tax=Candidatus Fischerbacteria bacterium RBG_13_37_8 TaxID=1817863 RepID=A0A1F5VIR6_9BACT|nr:MAG: hypothetical protein A2Y62_00490 [Candidatus Fischerbacteria bacterium RBG_13_37_8]